MHAMRTASSDTDGETRKEAEKAMRQPKQASIPREWDGAPEKDDDQALKAKRCSIPNCRTLTLSVLCARHRINPDAPAEEAK